MGDFATWLAAQTKLLELEQEESRNRHKPESVGNLRLSNSKIGAFGRATLSLCRDNAINSGDFPNGTPVKLVCLRWREDKLGVVKRFLDDNQLEVSCKEVEEPSFEHDITMVSLPDETTLKRVHKALAKAESSRFAQILFGDFAPRFDDSITPTHEALSQLNAAQQHALQRGVAARDLAIIWGPPGTGKTHTLARLLEALLRDPKKRILCVAPSNVAVDNILAVLIKTKLVPKEWIVRIGHPTRVDQDLHAYTLDSILANSDVAALVLDAKNELASTRDKQRKAELRQEIKSRERAFVRELFSSRCRIVMSTISSSAQLEKLVPAGFYFSTLVVDECAQATESSVWVPLQYLHPTDGVLILAGDHKQLPPTVLSQEASQGGLSVTMMDRLMAKRKEASTMLLEQYRMCQDIMAWSGKQMYESRLVAHQSVRSRSLIDLVPSLQGDLDLFAPLVMIDTAGCDLFEDDNKDVDEGSSSRTNSGEVELVVEHTNRLLALGLLPTQIAVISPYKGQVNLIKDRLPHIEVRSVDGFQGQERDVVIISMVRSNNTHTVGFLQDERRLNVAITRAKRHVYMIGDSSTLESNAMLHSLIEHFEANGQVRSAMEFNIARSSAPRLKSTKQKPKPVAPIKKEVKRAPVAAPQPVKMPLPPQPKPAMFSEPPKEKKILQGFAQLAEESDDDEEEEEMVVQKAVIPFPPPPPPKQATKLTFKQQEEDEDDFLDRMVQSANDCCFETCRTKTTMIGHDCTLCKQRFCLKHRQPELHGCGKQAKKTAMQANYSKAPPLKASDRAKLQEKLKGRISKEEQGRTSAVKTKPKSKQ